MPVPIKEGATLERILDAAEEMIQTRGYNAVSFRDLAARVDVKSASIHYYFQSKKDLGVALVRRYRERFSAVRDEIDRSGESVQAKLSRYVKGLCDAFRATGRMCLCGVLAAEASSLPREVVEEVRLFFQENEAWLAGILELGRREGAVRFAGSPAEFARSLFAALEGALMSAWTFSDEKRLASAARWLLASIEA